MAPHLHINAPSPAPFICILDLSRSETRASRLDTFFLDEYFLPSSHIHLFLSLFQGFPNDEDDPTLAAILLEWRLERERERIQMAIKRDKSTRSDFDPLPFAFSG